MGSARPRVASRAALTEGRPAALANNSLMAWSSGFQLRIVKGNQQGLVLPLTEQVYILGRATTQGETAPGYMFFYEPTVSRVHAELRWNEKKKSYFVHHQSKTNPTLVEGVPVDKKSPRPLDKGHKIQMGYLVLEVESLSTAAVAEAPRAGAGAGAAKSPESAKTHKMMVGNILEALSNLNQERSNTSRLNTPAPPNEVRSQPRVTDPEPPRPATPAYLERDYAGGERGAIEIHFMVAQGPDQGEVFVLREQVGIIGRSFGRDDPRRGQGVLLHDDSLPKEAAYVVWQNRDQAYGLTESDTPGVAIRVRRVQQGQPVDLSVGNGPPVLLQDGDVVQMGRSSLVVRAKGGAAMKEWSPREVEKPVAPPRATPIPLGDVPAGVSRWERPSEATPVAPPAPAAPPTSVGSGGGIVPRNFPGASGSLSGALSGASSGGLSSGGLDPAPPAPTAAPLDPSEAPTAFSSPPPAPPVRKVEATFIGRGGSSSGSSGMSGMSGMSPMVTRNEQPAAAPAAPTADMSNAATLGTASAAAAVTTMPQPSGTLRPGPPSGPLATPDERSNEAQPLSWPWRDNSDFVFDFTSGPNRGRQIALNANEMQDDRVITLGSDSAGQFDIPLDGSQWMAALRYRSRRFALLNQGPDDSVQVNRVPLKRGDQVVLMTGDRIDIGESTFRFLERAVVEVLQGFQVVVESGVDNDQDKVYPFYKQRLLIGRGKNCDIRLTDLEVSRIHVALVHRDGKFFVQHRSETNPTFLNGMSLLQGGERLISPGDRIRLSSLTLLQFAKAEPRKRGSASPSAR
jgi:pSer/pThr/pTyr-binding forkhead associated (FHA) protein